MIVIQEPVEWKKVGETRGGKEIWSETCCNLVHHDVRTAYRLMVVIEKEAKSEVH